MLYNLPKAVLHVCYSNKICIQFYQMQTSLFLLTSPPHDHITSFNGSLKEKVILADCIFKNIIFRSFELA